MPAEPPRRAEKQPANVTLVHPRLVRVHPLVARQRLRRLELPTARPALQPHRVRFRNAIMLEKPPQTARVLELPPTDRAFQLVVCMHALMVRVLVVVELDLAHRAVVFVRDEFRRR